MDIPRSKIKGGFTHLKSKIIALRKLGKTHSEIRAIYNVPKSTLSNWLHNLKVSPRIKAKIQKRARKKWLDNNKRNARTRAKKAAELRGIYKKDEIKEIKNVSKKDLKYIGAALYWAEGSVSNRNSLRFGNSNPLMIKTIMKFFRETCNIQDEKIRARIHLYPRINKKNATNFWMKITNLPRANFHPPQIQVSKASKGKRPRNTLPMELFHLTICNTELTCRVKGWIQGIAEKI